MRSGDVGVICARPGHLLWTGVRMTAMHQASVGVRIKQRVEEREVASSHDLEEDCGERMEHSKNMAKNRTDSMAALEIMTRRDTTMMVIFSRILSKTAH